MTPLAWVAWLCGVIWGGAVLGAALADVWLIRTGRRTISSWCYHDARLHPLPHALFWGTAIAGLALLLLHLYAGWFSSGDQ